MLSLFILRSANQFYHTPTSFARHQLNKSDTPLTIRQHSNPHTEGIAKASRVSRILPVSFLTVKRVVVQGQCISENISTHKAVVDVQPFAISNSLSIPISVISTSVPELTYAITAMGMTISFAGIPRMKAIIMTSLTTILAVCPFLSKGNMGDDLQYPMSIVIIVGMTVGTLVSLFVLPALYYSIYRRKDE